MPIQENDIVEIMIGIAQTQAAIVDALREPNDVNILRNVRQKVGGLLGHGSPSKTPITYRNVAAQLFLKAFATSAGPGVETLEQLAHREFDRLSHKT